MDSEEWVREIYLAFRSGVRRYHVHWRRELVPSCTYYDYDQTSGFTVQVPVVDRARL